ncbi:MAG: GNAT family N-acetyltransferase [Caulobacterales bacterium]|jgi:RimJ/RimL family protein N-acetyltransferase
MPAPTLEAPPARLRALALDDAAALFPAFADPVNMTYWSCPPHADIAETRADIAWWLDNHGQAAWSILDSDGAVAGRTGLVTLRAGIGEVGVILRPDAAGKGLARAAVGAMVDYGFAALGLHRIAADIDPDNAPSRRLFEALGFGLEGTLKHNWRTHLGLRDTVMYARLAPTKD